MSEFHLAQINVAQGQASMDSEQMQSFVDRLEEINALADKSPGFVWRLQTEEGDATSIKAFDDPLMLVNMSVWEDIDSLQYFVYKSTHAELLRDRDAWFNKMITVHQVLWWIPAGHRPTVDEGKEKLNHLQNHGASKTAFTFARIFEHD